MYIGEKKKTTEAQQQQNIRPSQKKDDLNKIEKEKKISIKKKKGTKEAEKERMDLLDSFEEQNRER